MGSWCGSRGLYPTDPEGRIHVSECMSDLISLLPHGFLILAILPNMFYRWLKLRRRSGAEVVRFPGHTLRWTLTYALLYVHVLEITEGVLSGRLSQGIKLHLFLPHVIAFLCSLSTLVFYNFTETHNMPGYLLALLIYWVLTFAARGVKFVALIGAGVGWEHSRFLLVLVGLILTAALIVIDIYVLYTLRYLSKHKRNVVPPEEMKNIKYVHPYANFISRMTLDWLTPLLWKGHKTQLGLSDLGGIPEVDRCETNHAQFERNYNSEKEKADKKGGEVSLWKVYFLTFWKPMAVAGLLKVTAEMLVFFPPMGVDILVQYVQAQVDMKNQTLPPLPSDDKFVTHTAFFTNGFVIIILTLLANLIQGTCWQQQFYLSVKQGIRCKGAVQAMVYSKSLRLSTWTMSEGGVSVGQVMNHMAVDPLNLVYFFYFGNFAWSLPLQIMVGIVLLYMQLGVSGLIGAFIILSSCPLNMLLAKVQAEQEEFILKYSDTRLKQVNEVLQSMKLLKMYAWEMLFKRSVEETREKELKHIMKACIVRIAGGIIVDGFPLIAILVTFSVYPSLEEKPLEAGKVFSSVALFNLLAIPVVAVPLIVGIITHAYVSTNRLTKYLATPELCTTTVATLPINTSPSDVTDKTNDVISSNDVQTSPDDVMDIDDVSYDVPNPADVMVMKKGTFAWDLAGTEPVIHDVDVRVKQGQLVLVVGTVGSGKSSLLSALVGEMTRVSGSVAWREDLKVAFGAQKAWLMNATLKENILFGARLDEERYERVLQASALKPDLEILPAGDATEIGEKGINLSGGQKQRISIARTLYTDADVILLDDPFSALDAHVGSHIFKEGVVNFLLRRGKTVVVVTHQLQFLPYAHLILAMKGGRVQQQGSLKQIRAQSPGMYEEWKTTLGKPGGEGEGETTLGKTGGEGEGEEKVTVPPASGEPVLMGTGMRSYLSTMSLGQISGYALDDDEDHAMMADDKLTDDDKADDKLTDDNKVDAGDKDERGKLIEEEERDEGAVKASVYWAYFKSATVPMAVWTIIGYGIRQGFRIATDFWLAKWSEDAHAHHLLQNLTSASVYNSTAPPGESFDNDYYIGVFTSVCMAAVVFGSVASTSMYLSGLKASRFFHSGMLSRLLLAPMRFFDTTPVGRIINRFAGDTNIIDHKIPTNLDNLVYSLYYCAGGIIVNAISTPFFIIPVIPILIIYLAIQRFYVSSSRELQRVDNVSQSPVLAQFSETLGGLTTIRAYRDQLRFEQRNRKLVDDNLTASLYLHTATMWMGVRLDYLGALIVFISALCSVMSGMYGWTSPGVVGLAVAYAIMISGLLNWMMRYISEAEMRFSCVERVRHYTAVTMEMVTQGKPRLPAPEWPERGDITFDDVTLRYDVTLEPVIDKLTLEIQGGQKVGICGRTGSGKSSLTLGLFRIIDICKGKICIDGIDIKDVPLNLLRSRLSIIPQDPVLFEGTVRYNLDPENNKSDKELWDVLSVVQLKETITENCGGLETRVSEGGENFSAGQRQLFCIARAILRESKILVMDEATASIDMATDALIQGVIKTAFSSRTVITIAHRVATILNCDRIIVLSQGKVIEYDTPDNLLKQDTVFASLVRDNK